MKKTLISIAAIVALSAGVAHAGNNNGPVFGGTQNYTTTNNTTNAPVANGGVGHGGDASAVGVGTGIGHGGSASSTVRNDVSNTNVNANANHNTVRNDNVNAQGQGQKQGQGQLQGQLQGQQQNAISGGNKLTNEGNNSAQSTSVKVEGDVYEAPKVPVATAYAPMVNNTANCAIGVSGGIQAATWGISGGSAFESETCVTIEQAKVAKVVFNDVATGEELMCSLAKYREARKSAGRPCNADKKAAATAGAQQTAAFEHTDPIVRARIGLPPLSK